MCIESRTSGELVAVIAHRSDDYLYIPVLWAALSALIVPGPLLFFDVTGVSFSVLQVATFLIAAALLRWPVLKMRFIPREVKRRRAALMAKEQFLEQNLHHTAQRNGILIYISVAEHYVELIADKGVNDVVPLGTWDTLVQQLLGHIRQGEIEVGLITTVRQCGDILEQHFPAMARDINELPNHLVEITEPN
ncbi:MAG: TPM domain-containing protein [Gammaproteobacteria bacterium]|nr:TPM domain-containing protein [Gammaproteobacteria bacterium]